MSDVLDRPGAGGEDGAAPDAHPQARVAMPEPVVQPRRRPTKLDKSVGRIVLVTLAFGLIFAGILARLAQLGLAPEGDGLRRAAQDQVAAARPDIVDRNGKILATDVEVPSLYAEPRKLIDVDEATELLTAVLPDLDAKGLREKLASKKGFVWLKRQITPAQQADIYRLGLPGIGFVSENKRIYPNRSTISHVIGAVNTDNEGIAGIEKYIDNSRGLAELHALGYAANPADLQPLQLSIDLGAQAVVRDELMKGMERFKPKAAAGAIMDVTTGEMVSLVSLPDFDPNVPADALDPNRINRVNVGVFEMGSTFKALDLAMGIESGRFTTASTLDAIHPMYYGRYAITDYHAQHRMLTLPEVFTYSSNLGAARIALAIGTEGQKAFLRLVGQLDRLVTELPENAAPLYPSHWGEVNTVTISYGHGIAVAPLQAMMAVGSMMNGGNLIRPTFLRRTAEDALAGAKPVMKAHTSDVMRYILRLNATNGSAKKADIPGYDVGGKTGTAEKIVGGHYVHNLNFTTFMAVFPIDKPKYLVLCLYDEPHATKESYGYTTAAWNAGETTGKIIERVAPLLGMAPRFEPIPNPVPPLYPPAGQGLGTGKAG